MESCQGVAQPVRHRVRIEDKPRHGRGSGEPLIGVEGEAF